MTLGASLHAILTRLKSQPQLHPHLDLTYSPADPVLDPILLSLPDTGLRLRFDGPDQRLRLIEIVDFSKSTFIYKSTELVRRNSSDSVVEPVPGPSFKHLYNRMFGPSYPGEYLPSASDDASGTYVLSWPGVAARFSLKQKSWSEKADFVSLLSTAASPATALVIFSGSSWPEVRSILYTRRPHLPRSLALSSKAADLVADEVEEVVIHEEGRIELLRRVAHPFMIVLNETTPQDLVAELGPPDAIYRKLASGLSIHAGGMSSKNSRPGASPAREAQFSEHERSSSKSNYTDDSENEIADVDGCQNDEPGSEVFYNYFHHGFDMLVTLPQQASGTANTEVLAESRPNFVVAKVFLHGNVPGSYSFNRHRRCRWRVDLNDNGQLLTLTSEMRFNELSDILKDVWHSSYKDVEEEKRMQRGMVLNRGWGIGDSPESSIELLGGFEEGPVSNMNNAARSVIDANVANLNNTELFGFPGLLFEVLKNDCVSCVTVY